MQQRFERRGVVEAQVIEVQNRRELLSQVGRIAGVEQLQTGIDEVRLTLAFVAEVRQERAAVLERRQSVSCAEALPHPPTERAAGEVGIVEDRIETVGFAVARVA